MKRIGFALVPLVALVLVAELGLRVLGRGDEAIAPFTLPGEAAGLLELDEDLFWRMKPNATVELQGVEVRTNALGLRTPALDAHTRDPAEMRILSLGESTTFGNGIPMAETYSALLEVKLARALAPRPVRVINAGVPAWSTFQSLQYLRTRGLALEPDWVLFYHEGNDFLPSYVRASDNTVVGMSQSDAARHADGLRRLHRRLLRLSAIYRYLQNRAAIARIDRFQQAGGAPGERSARWLARVGDETLPLRFPVRVPPAERESLLGELVELARSAGFRLLLFHPAYRDSQPHECALTRFAERAGIELLEVYPLLHEAGRAPLYFDAMHPTREGHRRIADALLARMLAEGARPAEALRSGSADAARESSVSAAPSR